MKQLRGQPCNLSQTVIGKVTRNQAWRFNKRDYVLIADKKPERGYASVLLAEPPGDLQGQAGVVDVGDLDILCEGDVVAIDKEGIITVLFEKESSQNCLFLTDRCNCRCVMCPQQLGQGADDYRINLVLKLLSLIDEKTPHLGITGGEPTLARDGLLKIITTCKRCLPKTALTLLTNGINFSDESFVSDLANIKHPCLQVDVALYADTDDLHDRIVGVKAFWRVIKGLYNLASSRQRMGIRIVMHKMNFERLPQIASFIYHNLPFVWHVAFMEMETIGHAKDNLDDLWIDPFDYNELLEEAVRFLVYRDMNVSVYNAQLCVLKPSLWKYAKKSISDWKNTFLDQCDGCIKKNDCGGCFSTSICQSGHIKAIS